MNDFHPTEEKFEAHIEQHLNLAGFSSRCFTEYNRMLCFLRKDLIEFIRTTQPNKFEQLENIHGADIENKLLNRISKEIARRGIIDVLRNQIVDHGIYFDLCYFKPKSGLNPDHQALYQLNRFTVIRQLHYSSQNENSIDMVLFLNGLPLITAELKNQLTGQDITNSENQYKKDRDPREPLLRFKRCVAHFCVDNNKASMTTKLDRDKTVFLPYNKGIENPQAEHGYRTQYIWQEILTPDSILNILEHFVHVSKVKDFFYNEKTSKIDSTESENLIFPRYHQLELIRNLRSQIRIDGVGTNYLVQHTTGSGKSYSIGWLSHALTSLYRTENDSKRMFDTIVVITDKKVLDNQLRNTIRSLEQTTGVVGGVEKGSAELKEFLEKGRDIVVTTIQKFPFISETIASLGHKSFAVIIDEVHSSQSGEMSKELKKSLSKVEDDGEFDYEQWLVNEMQNRGRQRHISFFGFTGTPKEKTLEIFGTKIEVEQFKPFHVYSMRQSINENFTLDVLQNYTTYKRYFKLKSTYEGEKKYPKAKATKKLIEYVDSAKETIEYKVNIMLDHWIEKGSKEIQGRARAMIVTQSRRHCVQYFQEVNRQLKERGLNYRALVAFSGEVSYEGDSFTESRLNTDVSHRGDIAHGLKNPKYRILIIANKFQTGFDEPLLQTMYVDKRLQGVQCVQTLSRLNRTMHGKNAAFVLDFVNDTNAIIEAFQRFYISTILKGETDPNTLYDTKSEIEQYYLHSTQDVDSFCKIFFNPIRNEGDLHPILDRVVDAFLELANEEQEEFKSRIQKFIRLYGYLSQIINFTDIELEKSNVFLRYLNRKLPKRDSEIFDLSDSVDLDLLRIQKTHELDENLIDEESIVEPHEFSTSIHGEPERDMLFEIIKQVNQSYGINLTDDDKLNLERVRNRLHEDSEVRVHMQGDSSYENKREYFKDQFNKRMIELVNNDIEFYKKIEENSSMKNKIFQMMLKDYENHHFNERP